MTEWGEDDIDEGETHWQQLPRDEPDDAIVFGEGIAGGSTPINLASQLAELIHVSTRMQEQASSLGIEAIPTYQPDDDDQPIDRWLHKIDELRELYNWNERRTIYYATSKLDGMAKLWYKSLPTINFTWNEWKVKLLKAFPPKRDYAETLRKMMDRKWETNESIIKYFYEKLALLNKCGISGRKAVSCVIHGLNDTNLKIAARVKDYEEPEDLLQFLRQIKDNIRTSQRDFVSRNREQVQSRLSLPHGEPGDKRIRCYECGSENHVQSECFKKRKTECNICKRFHYGVCFNESTKKKQENGRESK